MNPGHEYNSYTADDLFPSFGLDVDEHQTSSLDETHHMLDLSSFGVNMHKERPRSLSYNPVPTNHYYTSTQYPNIFANWPDTTYIKREPERHLYLVKLVIVH